jgi:hypothetical protein
MAAAAMCLLPIASSAQDGLRSASLPERPLTSALSPEQVDLFLAGPDTYKPRPDGRTIYDLPFGLSGGYWYPGDIFMPAPLPYGHLPCAGMVRGCPVMFYAYRDPDEPQRSRGRRRSGVDPPPAAPPVPPAPGVPKTFYVIPGCYAGDKRPQPEWLAPGCDLSRVRVVPP